MSRGHYGCSAHAGPNAHSVLGLVPGTTLQVSVHQSSGVSMYQSLSVSVHQSLGVSMHQSLGVSVHRSSGVGQLCAWYNSASECASVIRCECASVIGCRAIMCRVRTFNTEWPTGGCVLLVHTVRAYGAPQTVPVSILPVDSHHLGCHAIMCQACVTCTV